MLVQISSSMGSSAPPQGALRITPQTLPPLVNTDLSLGADIALVGPDRGLFAMQELVPDATVMHLRRRRLEAVNGAAVRIDPDMGLHAEIPGIAFIC